MNTLYMLEQDFPMKPVRADAVMAAVRTIGQISKPEDVENVIQSVISRYYEGSESKFKGDIESLTGALPRATIDVVRKAVTDANFAASLIAQVEMARGGEPSSPEWQKVAQSFHLDKVDLLSTEMKKKKGGNKNDTTLITATSLTSVATSGPTVITVTTIATMTTMTMALDGALHDLG